MATVYEYFQRALRRPPAVMTGEPVQAEDQSVAFHLQERGGIIHEAAYRCTSCITLIALCQHASELVTGGATAEADKLSAEQIIALHPEIPSERRNRAELVVQAIHQALIQLRRNNA